MTCFILPDSIINEIEAACAKFWWGTTPDHKGVHWMKWKDLCQPKALGGMGFKDLSMFNMAMLGKQLWRILQRPDSLLSRVLKAKYFPHSTIWEVDTTHLSSYTWKSILWGRNLVAKGIRWRVGNGESLSIYKSRWLPIPWTFMITSPKVLSHQAKVSDLLLNNGCWNEELIRSSFLEHEANLILSLQRP
ncbi:hypothetical protein UlMin_038612 [Ulmus minor]